MGTLSGGFGACEGGEGVSCQSPRSESLRVERGDVSDGSVGMTLGKIFAIRCKEGYDV